MISEFIEEFVQKKLGKPYDPKMKFRVHPSLRSGAEVDILPYWVQILNDGIDGIGS
jgi:hypothetical protein